MRRAGQLLERRLARGHEGGTERVRLVLGVALHVPRAQHDRQQRVRRRGIDGRAPAEFGQREALRGVRDQDVDHLKGAVSGQGGAGHRELLSC
jgi:hypothetical protein